MIRQYSPFIYFGCTYENALNYDENANVDDGSCEYMFGDLNQDGGINILDISSCKFNFKYLINMDTFSHALWGKGLFGYRKYILSHFFGAFLIYHLLGYIFSII